VILVPTIPARTRRRQALSLPLHLDTPAKINPYLRVTGRRADGYHDISTVFLPLRDLTDRVVITPARQGRLTVSCRAPGVPDGEGNLAWRAAAAFAQATGIEPAWRIGVRKEIPVAAGLGGGSSDAAAVLRLLHALHPVLADADLLALAARLGADVPFFLDPAPKIATGIGEKLAAFPLRRPLPVLLVFPEFPISAAWAYAHWQPDPTPAAIAPLLSALRARNLARIRKHLANDLAPAAFAKFPLLRLLRQVLADLGAETVGMTGSGPSLFAFLPQADDAHRLARSLRRSFSGTIRCRVAHAG
jgi:4-diphosphocytidyl-2-C-methyl-D-erythritol kinase